MNLESLFSLSSLPSGSYTASGGSSSIQTHFLHLDNYMPVPEKTFYLVYLTSLLIILSRTLHSTVCLFLILIKIF